MSKVCGICGYPDNVCKCNADADYGFNQEIKQTIGKVPLGNLLDFKHALEQVSKVRAFGNNKYPNKHSYKEIPTPLLMDATFRHLFNDGLDDESGVHHIYHAVVNLLMIAEKDRL